MENLCEIFEKYGVFINKNQENLFDLYFHHLVETNKHFNLTAITKENDVRIKHFLDSVLGEEFIPAKASVVDVGSGAGFPALPLKIARPDLEICMVDSLQKRVNFLNEVISLLGLEKTIAVHARAEDFAKEKREMFDVSVARAVAPLNTLVEYMLPLIKIGGSAVIYKSAKLEEELANAEKAIQILGGKVEKIVKKEIKEEDFEAIERQFLLIRKIKSTPKKYPRSQNKPKADPIH